MQLLGLLLLLCLGVSCVVLDSDQPLCTLGNSLHVDEILPVGRYTHYLSSPDKEDEELRGELVLTKRVPSLIRDYKVVEIYDEFANENFSTNGARFCRINNRMFVQLPQRSGLFNGVTSWQLHEIRPLGLGEVEVLELEGDIDRPDFQLLSKEKFVYGLRPVKGLSRNVFRFQN